MRMTWFESRRSMTPDDRRTVDRLHSQPPWRFGRRRGSRRHSPIDSTFSCRVDQASRRVCELPCPTALGASRPSLGEDRASCFYVGTCTRRGHSGSRLRRRRPFTSVPLLPDGHSATTDGARFLSRVNTASDVVSIGLPYSTVWVRKAPIHVQTNYAALSPLPTPSLRSGVEDGA
jgi:hypothetical protein